MTREMEQPESLRDFARKRLKKQAEFREYLGVWAAVALITSAVWWLTTPGGYYWPVWAIFGMGVAAIFIGLDAYGPESKRYITEDEIDEEVQRMRGIL